jgi:hypothetical protein
MELFHIYFDAEPDKNLSDSVSYTGKNPIVFVNFFKISKIYQSRFKSETVYESHLIPFFNGLSTTYSTLSRPVSTVTKTDYELVTNTLANALPPVPINPLNPFAQPQYQITSTPVVTSTSVTATESKVLKLTFGAKTAYTTLYSTRVVPTVLTTYLTTNVPVLPTAAAFPGFFPGAFGGFPGYVG